MQWAGTTIAQTTRGFRVLETSHPPVYYFPPEDVDLTRIRPAGGGSFCEWKGAARYFDLVDTNPTPPVRVASVAWSYPRPTEPFASMANHIAFYADKFDACFVDDHRVTPQPGRFYGGWITPDVVGPFKGGPGTMGW